RLRDELRGLPLGGARRPAGRRDADDRDRGVPGGVRALRHAHGLGDRRRDGRLPARRARRDPVPPPPDGGDGRGDHGRGEALMRGRLWRLAVFLFVVGFVLNLAGVVGHVLVSSFARRWFATPLPGALTTEWYAYAWREFQLDQVLGVTLTVAGTVTAAALVLGFPAAYLLARHDFRGKGPLALPGLLTAGLLVLVSTVANFELTFLLSGAGSQTLVVALYYAVFAAGMRPIYSVDAMAVIYMAVVLAVLVLALRFVRPTQMVFRLDRRD